MYLVLVTKNLSAGFYQLKMLKLLLLWFRLRIFCNNDTIKYLNGTIIFCEASGIKLVGVFTNTSFNLSLLFIRATDVYKLSQEYSIRIKGKCPLPLWAIFI